MRLQRRTRLVVVDVRREQLRHRARVQSQRRRRSQLLLRRIDEVDPVVFGRLADFGEPSAPFG
jgi:hypothetical protein